MTGSSQNTWLLPVGADKTFVPSKRRIFLTPWVLPSVMLSVRLRYLLSCPAAQPLTWTLTALLPELQPHSLFKLPLEQGVPVRLSTSMWAERSVASFSSLLTTSGKISQHLVNRPNQGSGWGGVLGGNSAANTQQCALFCCSETITTRGCHWEQWQLHSKSS